MKIYKLIFLACAFFGFQNHFLLSQNEMLAPKGTVYVPAYSSIHYGNIKNEYPLTITLSIHNIDLKHNITIDVIDYYNTSGNLIQRYILEKKISIKSMETYIIVITDTDNRGGIGSNFIVKWSSAVKVNKPIIESIMVGRREQLGISFSSRGVEVIEY